jgi:phospholipid-binding lipoprotein MlaA
MQPSNLLSGLARLAIVVGTAGTLAACALPPKDDPEALAEYNAANDPFESANRLIFAANNAVDSLVLQPVAVTYRDLAPVELKTPFENLITNLFMPVSFINAVLQGDWERADRSAQRLAGGLATLMLGNTLPNEEPVYEDAGQTLGVWGIDSGPYLMLPLLGPSNFRDATGTVVDFFVDPVGYIARPAASIGRGVGKATIDRSKNVDAVRDLQRNSLDYYAAVRSLYRQRRATQIENGNAGSQQTAPTIGQDWDGAAPKSDAPNVSAVPGAASGR